MKYLLLLFWIIIFSNCNSTAKIGNTNPKIDKATQIDIQKMLSAGLVNVEIRDSINYDLMVTIIRQTIIESLEKNEKWFTDYRKEYPEGQPFPYHSNLGVSKEDFDYYQKNKDVFGIKSTFKEQLEIIHDGLEISFKAKDKLDILNKIKVDLKENVVVFSDYNLKFSKKLNIPTNYNIYRSSWKGYKWIFSDPEIEGMDIWDMYATPVKRYSLTIGRIETTGLTFIDIDFGETYPEKENVKIDFDFIIQ
ncbi:MAG: hypothetical protein AB8H03_13650 [Saprospiraceae bacterium]